MTIKTTRPHNHEVAKEILHKERAKEGVNQTDEKAEKSIEDDYKKGDVAEPNEKGNNGRETDEKAGHSDDIKEVGLAKVGDDGSLKTVDEERGELQTRGKDSGGGEKRKFTKEVDLVGDPKVDLRTSDSKVDRRTSDSKVDVVGGGASDSNINLVGGRTGDSNIKGMDLSSEKHAVEGGKGGNDNKEMDIGGVQRRECGNLCSAVVGETENTTEGAKRKELNLFEEIVKSDRGEDASPGRVKERLVNNNKESITIVNDNRESITIHSKEGEGPRLGKHDVEQVGDDLEKATTTVDNDHREAEKTVMSETMSYNMGPVLRTTLESKDGKNEDIGSVLSVDTLFNGDDSFDDIVETDHQNVEVTVGSEKVRFEKSKLAPTEAFKAAMEEKEVTTKSPITTANITSPRWTRFEEKPTPPGFQKVEPSFELANTSVEKPISRVKDPKQANLDYYHDSSPVEEGGTNRTKTNLSTGTTGQ